MLRFSIISFCLLTGLGLGTGTAIAQGIEKSEIIGKWCEDGKLRRIFSIEPDGKAVSDLYSPPNGDHSRQNVLGYERLNVSSFRLKFDIPGKPNETLETTFISDGQTIRITDNRYSSGFVLIADGRLAIGDHRETKRLTRCSAPTEQTADESQSSKKAAGPDIMGVRLGNRIDALPREFSRLKFSRVGEHYELRACSNDEIVRTSVPALSNIDIGDMAAACLHLFAIGDVGPNARKIYAMMLHNYPMGAFQFMQGAANILKNRYGNPTEQIIGDRGARLGWGIGKEALNSIDFQSIRADNNGRIFNTQNAFTVSNTRIIHAAALFKTGYRGTWGPYSDPVRAVILMVDQQMFEDANRIVINNSIQQRQRALQEELQHSKTQGTRF